MQNSPCTNHLTCRGFAFHIGRLAFIEPVAERSSSEARFVLDAEIIPRRAIAVLLPPFHGDAFGPFYPHHCMA